jgi:pheromone shutdown protein TraB
MTGRWQMITIVGVGHVFDIKTAIRSIISQRMPGIVCVELDKQRYESLLDGRQGGERGKGVPVGYRLLSSFQERIAAKYGGRPGDEMLAAIETARELGIDVAFIDMDAGLVFNNLWSQMTLQEKIKLMAAGFFGLFASKRHVDRELKKFEDNRDEYLDDFAAQFPSVKKVLIDDRDRHMAGALSEISGKYAGVVAVIGDGHVDGVRKILGDAGIETIRLRELLTDKWKTARDANRSVTLSISYNYPGHRGGAG